MSALREDLLVVLFPEGTSSDGATVLPFKSSLLQAAIEARSPIAAAGIDYQLGDGSVADEVCYWREMTLVPHLCEPVRQEVGYEPGRELLYLAFPNAIHNENAWAERSPIPFQFLFGKQPAFFRS